MKICILHHDLEFAEEEMKEIMEEAGNEVYFCDIRTTSVEKIGNPDLLLNRVYASVANRDYDSILKTLDLLKFLEEKGIFCLNSYETSLIDYNKYEAYKKMNKKNILTPKTFFIENLENVNLFIKKISSEIGYPLIAKRNVGGRGKDVSLIKNEEEFREDLKKKFFLSKKENYRGGFVAQEFIKSVKDYDCRIGIMNGEFKFSYGRGLISEGSEEKWLASISKGSKKLVYAARKNEINLALKTSNLIGSKFNELDIMFSEKGPVIIENNPTPNYSSLNTGKEGFKIIVNQLLSSLK